MKAILCSRFGGPDDLEYADIPDPVAAAGEVVVAAEVDAGVLRLRVSDTGPGIDAVEHGSIFEMFHQGSAARRAGGSGLGLGLYIVRRLAHVLGGTARLVESTPGRTLFEVMVPLPPPPSA